MAFISRVKVATLAPLFAQAARGGVAAAALCEVVGLPRDGIAGSGSGDGNRDRDRDGEVAYDVVTALWQAAAKLTGDDAFGIHAAEGAPAGVFDVVEYAALTSLTVRDAIGRLCRYQRLLTEVVTFSCQGTVLRLRYRLGANRLPPSRHASEYLLASVVRKLRAETAAAQPMRIRFRHAAPAGKAALAELRRVFACEVEFGAVLDEIGFSREALAATLERADPALRAILDRHAVALLERLPAGELFSARVGNWLSGRLADGATLAGAARHFRLSERGLQRRLAAERDSFEQLLERTRRGEAARLLGDPQRSVADVAAALGFSEPSAFHRAFKRWHGVTPVAYRKRLA
jgi:AraC-like DNA-binding protein